VKQDELTWIRERRDPAQEFARKYYAERRVATHWKEGPPAMAEANSLLAAAAVVVVFLAAFLLPRGLWKLRGRIRRAAHSQAIPGR
jgi:hypothetical protein